MNKCAECGSDTTAAEVSMDFRAKPGGSWQEFQAVADVCTKCGRMNLYLGYPNAFKSWVESEKIQNRAAGA